MSTWFRTYGFGEVANRLIVGAVPLDAEDVSMLEWMGVRQVLNLVENDEYSLGEREAVEDALHDAGIAETRLPLTDFGGLSPEALDRATELVGQWLQDGELTYVHCRAGWQRSAAVAAGVVALREQIGIDDALAQVKRAKPSADPLEHQRADLRAWWDARAAGEGDPAGD